MEKNSRAASPQTYPVIGGINVERIAVDIDVSVGVNRQASCTTR